MDVVKDTVTSFCTKRLVLATGSSIVFDVLILATGSKWSDPLGTALSFGDNYNAHFEKQASLIKAAKDIVFIGGGYVNSEIIGELLFEYGDEIKAGKKSITVIHNSDKLLPENGLYSDGLRSRVTDYMSKCGVTLYLKTTGHESDSEPNKVILGDDASKAISADLVYKSVCILPSVPSNEIPNLCNKRGFIQVEKNFRVKACKEGNVFAIGDVTDFRYHGIIKRDNWVDVLTNNVTAFLNEGSNAKLTNASSFDSGHVPGGVSLGPKAGFGQVPLPFLGTVGIPSFVVTRLKSKDLLKDKMEDFFKK